MIIIIESYALQDWKLGSQFLIWAIEIKDSLIQVLTFKIRKIQARNFQGYDKRPFRQSIDFFKSEKVRICTYKVSGTINFLVATFRLHGGFKDRRTKRRRVSIDSYTIDCPKGIHFFLKTSEEILSKFRVYMVPESLAFFSNNA